jgi:crossover junction endodeoxyribonuclease RuvC
MRILGIDPGTITMGYGLVEGKNETPVMICCGIITPPSKLTVADRLSHLYSELTKLIKCYQPSEVAIEEPFVAKNARSALAVGRAEAIAMLAAANEGIPVYSYTPTQIKRSVTNYGNADKEQVQEMVRLQLGLSSSPQPNDAADALAVAICHLRQSWTATLMTEAQHK